MNALDPSTVAAAALAVLPSPQPLTVSAGAFDATDFAQAAVAEVVGTPGAAVAVLVSQTLVDALKGTPIGDLSLADASQPALDAIGQALEVPVRAAQLVSVSDVASFLGSDPVAVPLAGPDGSFHAAVMLSETLLLASSTETLPQIDGMSMLHGVIVDVTVEIGRTRMSIRDLLSMAPGAVLELDRAADSPADLLVNGKLIARGEVVVVDEDFALRLTEVLKPEVS
jgi:flagellar motor switch protein FliN/FliY